MKKWKNISLLHFLFVTRQVFCHCLDFLLKSQAFSCIILVAIGEFRANRPFFRCAEIF